MTDTDINRHPDTPQVDAPPQPAPPEPPPSNVAGQAALDGEAKDSNEDGDDTRPVLDVRGREFHLRSGVPQVLIGDLMSKLRGIDKISEKEPKERTEAEQHKMVGALTAIHNGLLKLLVVDERDDFVEYAADVEPAIAAKEWSELMSRATEAISGRPTTAS